MYEATRYLERGRVVEVGPRLADDGVEAVDRVGRVVHGAHGAVGLHQRVLALDHVAVAGLGGVLLVARVRVVDAVLERVPRMALRRKRFKKKKRS